MTIFPCYAPSDRQDAEELAVFLHRGARVEVCLDEGCIHPGENLIAKMDQALQADVALALLSPASAPAPWVLEEWTAGFRERPRSLGVCVATVLLGDCRFPPLLARERFFDLRADRLDGLRRLKQWLLRLRPPAEEIFFAPAPAKLASREPELETLRRTLGDSPGTVAVTGLAPDFGKTALAAEFAHRYRGDFQGVFWIRCGRRSGARVAGELASQLGLRLEGETKQNQAALRRFCSDRRCLIVLDDLASDAALPLVPGGWTSVLITTERQDLPFPRADLSPLGGEGVVHPEAPPRDPRSVYEAADATFSDLEEGFCGVLSLATDPQAWALACGLARRLVRRALEEGRLAEADEFLQRWFAVAGQRADRRVLDECARERAWILETWDRVEEARQLEAYRRTACQDQMSFDFAVA